MKRSGQYLSPQGKLALPLIVLAALCWLDQFLNAVDHVRLSMLLLTVLSFPLGDLVWWSASRVIEAVAPGNSIAASLILFVIDCAGTALNLYLISALIVYFRRQRQTKPDTIVSQDEFRRLLDEHHNHVA